VRLKLGQPQPESNFCVGFEQRRPHRAGVVPAFARARFAGEWPLGRLSRSTRTASASIPCRHSASLFSTLSTLPGIVLESGHETSCKRACFPREADTGSHEKKHGQPVESPSVGDLRAADSVGFSV